MSRPTPLVKRTQILVALLVATIGAVVVLELAMAYAFLQPAKMRYPLSATASGG